MSPEHSSRGVYALDLGIKVWGLRVKVCGVVKFLPLQTGDHEQPKAGQTDATFH